MKVAVSTQDKRPDAPVEPWFGRAAYFLITDTDSTVFDAIENERRGKTLEIDEIQAAQLVIDAGVEAVLTGNCGFAARRMLAGAGVRLFQSMPGTVKENIEQFIAGQLLEVPAPGLRQPVEAGVTKDQEV